MLCRCGRKCEEMGEVNWKELQKVRLCLFEMNALEMVVEEKLLLDLCVIIGVFPLLLLRWTPFSWC